VSNVYIIEVKPEVMPAAYESIRKPMILRPHHFGDVSRVEYGFALSLSLYYFSWITV
jgi:hypothetical protein